MPDRAAIVAWVVSFLLGSIPFGLLIARIFNVKDLTSQGSGNIGATNVSRVVGFWPAGFLTFALDVLKGAAPILLLQWDGFREWITSHGGLPDLAFTPAEVWAAALFAVLGHCYSPWLRFRGGKGVATGFGVMLVLSPLAALCGIAAFGLTFMKTRLGSLASMSGLIVATVAYVIFKPLGVHLFFGAALILVILVRHEGNLDALLENREKSFS